MTPTPLERATWLLNEFGHLASQRWPYVFGGGHGVAAVAGATFPPTKGVDPEGTNPLGYDCSAWQAAGLWHAGMLVAGSVTSSAFAPVTQELEVWGQAGAGQLYTLYVRDSGGVHHCVGKLTLPGQKPLWTAADRTGTVCGFQPFGSWDPTTEGYAARHYSGM